MSSLTCIVYLFVSVHIYISKFQTITGVPLSSQSHCSLRFPAPKSVLVQTLKMQVYFMDHAIDKHQIIEKHRDRLLAKTQPLTKDIIHSNSQSKQDDNIFFRKIAVDIIVQHSLGSPSKPEV